MLAWTGGKRRRQMQAAPARKTAAAPAPTDDAWAAGVWGAQATVAGPHKHHISQGTAQEADQLSAFLQACGTTNAYEPTAHGGEGAGVAPSSRTGFSAWATKQAPVKKQAVPLDLVTLGGKTAEQHSQHTPAGAAARAANPIAPAPEASLWAELGMCEGAKQQPHDKQQVPDQSKQRGAAPLQAPQGKDWASKWGQVEAEAEAVQDLVQGAGGGEEPGAAHPEQQQGEIPWGLMLFNWSSHQLSRLCRMHAL